MRLPRKQKKNVKKIVARKTATKTVMSAMVTAQALAQTAIISALPSFMPPAVTVADKSLKVAMVMIDTAKAIKQIMSEKPNSWRDFIKTRN